MNCRKYGFLVFSALLACLSFAHGVYAQRVNLNYNAPYGSSSAESGNDAYKGIDGSGTTRWGTDWSNLSNRDSAWFFVKFSAAKYIDSVVIKWASGASALHYKIQVSNTQSYTDASWTTVADITNGTDSEVRSITFPPVSAQYLRVRCYSRLGSYGYSFWEFESYEAISPTISTQPKSKAFAIDSAATFSVAATGTAPLSYHWFKNGVARPADISSTLTIAKVAIGDTGTYTVQVSNAKATVNSSAAVLTVMPKILTQPLAQNISVGSALTLTVSATGSIPLTYQWKKGGVALSGNGAATATYSKVTVAADSGLYTVDVGNSGDTVTSIPVAVSFAVVKPSNVVISPNPGSVAAGAAFTFTATASGTPPFTYQWQKDGVNIGTNIATYSIGAAATTDNGNYTVTVGNGAGNTQSNPVTLTVTVPFKASFKVSANQGLVPLKVFFVDSSTGAIGKRVWNYGDNSATDTGKSPSHTYSTEGSFNAKLSIYDTAGVFRDSAVVQIKTYKDNPVLLSGKYIGNNKVEISYDNYNAVQTAAPAPYADSMQLWYRPSTIPLSATGATKANTFPITSLKTRGNGATVKDTLTLATPLADTVYGFSTVIHWTTGWGNFSAVNGCLVTVTDTTVPQNKCAIAGKYLGADSVAVIISNMKTIDTAVVDTFGIWFGTTTSDSVPIFGSSTASRWFDLKQRYSKIASTGQDSIIITNTQFNTGVVKTVWCAIELKTKNDKVSNFVKSSYTVGLDRPINPIVLNGQVKSSSKISLTWNHLDSVATGIKAIRILYTAVAPIPQNIAILDTTPYQFINPSVSDTAVLVSGLQENTWYYFGMQIKKNGLWSVVTPSASAKDSTTSSAQELDSNTIHITHLYFDTIKNQIKVAWTVTPIPGADLEVGISYNQGRYPTDPMSVAQTGIGVKFAADSAVVELKEPISFSKNYYIALWERRTDTDGKWTTPTDFSRGVVTTPDFTWQTVRYFTKSQNNQADTAFAFNKTIRIMTTQVNAGSDQLVSDVVKIYNPDISQLAGFVPVSIAFSFGNPQFSSPIYVGLQYGPLNGNSPSDLHMYRFHDSVWVMDKNVFLDPMTNYVSVKTNDLVSPFMVMLDTQHVSVSAAAFDTVCDENPASDLENTFAVNDNCGNVICSFKFAKGSDDFPAKPQFADTISNSHGGIIKVTIPHFSVTSDNGLRAWFSAFDGVNTTLVDVSRQVRRTRSDFIKSDPLKWLPIRATALLDSQQLSFALKQAASPGLPWAYDPTALRCFKWYPSTDATGKKNNWLEYSDATAPLFKFTPGNLVWVKTKDEIDIDFGKAKTLPLATSVAVTLPPDSSWTDFAVPFRFNIKIGDVLDSTAVNGVNTDLLEFYSWEKASDTSKYQTTPLYLPPFSHPGSTLNDKTALLGCSDRQGYSIRNTGKQPVVLRLPPIPQAMSHYIKGALPKSKGNSGWAFKVCGSLSDGDSLAPVYCGKNPLLKETVRYFAQSPTFMQTYICVENPQTNSLYGHALAGGASDDGCAFKLAFVNKSDRAQTVSYRLAGEGVLTSNTLAKLYDESNGTFFDAAEIVALAPKETKYRWLFVGNQAYLAKAPLLTTVQLGLYGVYPNPFSSALKIKFSVPRSGVSFLKFTVCDLRGRIVWDYRASANEHAGQSEIYWNAQSKTGNKLGAGIYVLRMVGFGPNNNQIGSFEKKLTYVP